jgi:hypothetical protein
MANHVSVYVYRKNQDDLKNQNGTPATTGILFSFPVTVFSVNPSTVVANGVQMNSVITVAPTGLNQPADKYYTDSTVAGLVAASNGGGSVTTTTTAAPTTTTTTAAPTTTTTTAAA